MSTKNKGTDRAAEANSRNVPFSPEEWQRLVSEMELKAVVADDVRCHVDRDRLRKDPGQKLSLEVNYGGETAEVSESEVLFRFTLEIAVPGDGEALEGDETPPVVFFGLVYTALYSWTGSQKPSQGLLDSFRDRLAQLHVFPFVRAHVVDLTTRAGLPPLGLPLMKIDGYSESSDESSGSDSGEASG